MRLATGLDSLSESSCALAPVFFCALVKKDESINVISKNALSRILPFFLPLFFMHANRSKGRIVTNNNFIIYSFGLMAQRVCISIKIIMEYGLEKSSSLACSH